MNSYGEQIEKQVLCTAFSATCEKRKSIFSKDDIETTLHLVSNDLHMAEQTWSVRTLQRNILSQYYYRMLKMQKAMFYLQQQETEL